MKSRCCDVNNDWLVHLPELLVDAGAYQFHMDPAKAIDSKYTTGYRMKPAETVHDIINLDNREYPVSPALCLRKDLDGTNTPSQEGSREHNVTKLSVEELNDFKNRFPEKFSDKHNRLVYEVMSPKVAPVLGEVTNMAPPMFLDYDPKVKNIYKGSGKRNI